MLRAGLLIPSSNVVVEDTLRSHAVPDVTLHIARLGVTAVTANTASSDQFALGGMVEAMALLADTNPNALAWAGTSASWLGLARDRDLIRRLEDRFDIPATTTTVAVIDRLTRDGADRIGLVTPFTEDLGHAIAANFAAAGIHVLSARHLGANDSRSMADFNAAQIEDAVCDVARHHPKAVLCLCTNFRGALVSERLSQTLGLPVLDSVTLTLEAVVRMCRETAPPPK